MYRIKSCRSLKGGFHLLQVDAPAVVRHVQPGQFVVIRVDETGERIPLTVSDWDEKTGRVTVVFRVVGKTTTKLASLKTGGSILDFAGPLGVPADIEKFGHVICVGVDFGVAGMVPIAAGLKRAGNSVTAVIRAPDKSLLSQADRLREACDDLIVTTDDGSEGDTDFITEPLKKLLGNDKKADRVICMAPTCISRYCASVTRPFNVKTMVHLNPIMLDGTGMCGTCRVSVGGETKFACVHGPEFDGHEVDWNLLMARRCRCSDQRQPWTRGFHDGVRK